ncbi:MAG: hypothetical protein QG625_2239 [Cyanobacteriota bacterium erpe_2018_sw_39hr_WHONDRS-SW48-000098_B_bin.30]|jgi:hypothetical protein|nr:hypothetical protein [Candidatus Obscuribacter sp.]MBK7839839.1 hypothetical protein [Candidatus Obscuribacter sp.]MDQ5966084.1 hypothetical protein [Cyanobacteriota bacterium erpe_2018_sw_39hr_WHONDRS-SW48-000098_B_bin.30]
MSVKSLLGFAGPRRTNQDPPPDRNPTDSYFEKLMKYIPLDIVAAWVALDGILKEQSYVPLWLSWVVFGALTVLTPLYVLYVKTTPPGFASAKTFHWMASTFAFVVWIFALGGPFAITFDWYRPIFGSVLLILTTLTLPVFESIYYGPLAPPIVPPPPPVIPPAAPPNTAASPPANPQASDNPPAQGEDNKKP